MNSSKDSIITSPASTSHLSDTNNFKSKQSELDSLKNLHIFIEFAVNYNPSRTPNSGVATLPDTPDSVYQALRFVKRTQPKVFEKYLTLIFVKLYSAHLECCHQSYEVRRKSSTINKEHEPLVYEFNTLTKTFPVGQPIEFISSAIGYDYVSSNPHLLDFKPIKKHMKIIEQMHKNINEGVYWE
ncbi:MAG: hypothetical protein KBB37_13485 [Bacteroidia bacterium]|nr:hypothetical protein [Bacteroidia bacterium]MBP7262291.1 hypothetical protein [Bacteroidia bacterium]MBP9179790.1 hypothetical protein [Bacteroidia bacterium]